MQFGDFSRNLDDFSRNVAKVRITSQVFFRNEEKDLRNFDRSYPDFTSEVLNFVLENKKMLPRDEDNFIFVGIDFKELDEEILARTMSLWYQSLRRRLGIDTNFKNSLNNQELQRFYTQVNLKRAYTIMSRILDSERDSKFDTKISLSLQYLRLGLDKFLLS